MAIANITNNILTDSGISTSSLLPLTGGTLTGPLNGTSATFSSSVTANGDITIPNGNYYYAKRNTGGSAINVLGFASGSDTLTIKGGTSGATNSINFEDTGGQIATFYNGRFGIGTSSPTNTLTLQNTGENSLEFHRSNAMQGMLGIPSASNQIITGSALNDFCFRATTKMLFATGGDTERMRITSGGNVLIGTSTAPSSIGVSDLLVIGKSGSASNAINFSNGSTTNWGYLLAESGKMVFGSGSSSNITFETNAGSERMRITSGGVINTTSRLNVNGAGDNSLFSLINNGTTYTLGFSPNATSSTSTTLTITTATTTWIYNGTGTATWTLPNPSGTNQMFWIRNAGTGTLTLNAFSGTNIVNTANSLVSSITIAVGATALIQQDGNIRSYQLQ